MVAETCTLRLRARCSPTRQRVRASENGRYISGCATLSFEEAPSPLDMRSRRLRTGAFERLERAGVYFSPLGFCLIS
jgi:hypothetical protein